MAEFSQQGRLLQLLDGGPLTPREAVATRMAGAEGLSRPFRFVVDLLANKAEVAPAKAVGAELSVLLFGHERSKDVHTARVVHGMIARWTEHGSAGTGANKLTHYRAELVPWLSLLSLSAKTRTYEGKSVDQIVTDVFEKAGFRDKFRFLVTRTLEPRPYVAQYAESDFAFVSRLLEEEGLYYRFEHFDNKHILQISDKRGSGLPAGVVTEMPFKPIVNKAPISGVPIIGPLAGLLGSLGRSGAGKGAAEGAAAGGAVVGALLTPLGVGPIAGSLASAGISALADLVLNFLFTPTAIVTGDAVTELHRERAVHTETAATRDFHLLRPAETGMEVTSGPGARGEYFEFLGDQAGRRRPASPPPAPAGG